MKKFIVTYDFQVYKPSNIHIYERQKAFSLEVNAESETDARQILIKEHNKNPFYFKFTEV